jgi:hypothetical protein
VRGGAAAAEHAGANQWPLRVCEAALSVAAAATRAVTHAGDAFSTAAPRAVVFSDGRGLASWLLQQHNTRRCGKLVRMLCVLIAWHAVRQHTMLRHSRAPGTTFMSGHVDGIRPGIF